MDKSALILITLSVLILSIIIFGLSIFLISGYLQIQKIREEEESFLISNVSLVYEGGLPVINVKILNTGNTAIKIMYVAVYYAVTDINHLIGEAYFVESGDHTTTSTANPLILLNGFNPIPPGQESLFKAKLEVIRRSIAPGSYIVEVSTNRGSKQFAAIALSKESEIKATLQKYWYQKTELYAELDIENSGNVPLELPSEDLKVYVDGREHFVAYEREYFISPGEKERVRLVIPFQLVPYSNPAGRTYPYIKNGESGNLYADPKFVASMLEEHEVVIEIRGKKIEFKIPSVRLRCRVLDVGKYATKDVSGAMFWVVRDVKLEVTPEWIDYLDLGWLNQVEICTGNLCEPFVVANADIRQENATAYLVTLYPSMALYPADGREFTLNVYYGELKIASIKL